MLLNEKRRLEKNNKDLQDEFDDLKKSNVHN